jgi:hypothetical protein
MGFVCELCVLQLDNNAKALYLSIVLYSQLGILDCAGALFIESCHGYGIFDGLC